MVIARRLVVRPRETPAKVFPGFIDLGIHDENRTGMRFVVER
jgi:stage V sporulation protein SpoVS